MGQLVRKQLDAVFGQQDELHGLELLQTQSVKLLNQGASGEHLLRLGMILYHGLDYPQHQCILVDIFWVVDLRLSELRGLSYHKLEQVIELGHIISDRVLDKVLVDRDALDYVNDSLDVELASEGLCRDGGILA